MTKFLLNPREQGDVWLEARPVIRKKSKSPPLQRLLREDRFGPSPDPVRTESRMSEIEPCPFNPECAYCWAHHLGEEEMPHVCPDCYRRKRIADGVLLPWEAAYEAWRKAKEGAHDT